MIMMIRLALKWMTFLLLIGVNQSKFSTDICSFENVALHKEMLDFTGQLVLKVTQSMLLTATKIFDLVIKELEYMTDSNPALRFRLNLLSQHIQAIEESKVLDVKKFSSSADLSVLANFYDMRVQIESDSDAIIPKLARLCNNVLNTDHARRFSITNKRRNAASSLASLTLEDELIAQSLERNGMPLMRVVMAAHLTKFFEELDEIPLVFRRNLRCWTDREFLTLYNRLKASPTEASRLERAISITFAVLYNRR
ncbi:uncharacterized protein Dwil_GK27239 [Drosophila willistoni]|uniref:Uncharacterized protein n=1 Tax=Drosophila willistoni TaxID=7260 RepID=A0A0Q9WXX3_DROWI|nr:uncharacterized protein LOC26529241 [Drosophila willistoni]KRG00281.1 uncharacterized protein Dwil_GK27239 [Drosophila willistoni]